MLIGSVKEFESYVANCRAKKLPTVIENTSEEYAGVLLKNLLIFARDEKADVELVSGSLLARVYGPLAPLATEALNAGCNISVIAVAAVSPENPFYAAIKSHSRGRIESLNAAPDSQNHFMAVGKKAYRVETDDHVAKAFACFNDEVGIVPGLNKKFDQLWQQASSGGSSGRSISVGVP